MRHALITTTINVPTVLRAYRGSSFEVGIFIAGDEKTPHSEVSSLAASLSSSLGEAVYLSPDDQRALNYRCSDLLGWNTIGRRNIALLEALKWGAEVITTVDDDNIPLGDYFDPLHMVEPFSEIPVPRNGALGQPFSGCEVSSPTGWFDVGTLLDPIAPHRGFPTSVKSECVISPTSQPRRCGAAAGICLGDPDISAATRLVNAPTVHRVSQLLEAGIVVAHDTRTVFNSQNTTFLRELAPAMFMIPGVGRYDDIFASLICQEVMRARDLYVHFGRPFVWQQRNAHNLVDDLGRELLGMRFVEDFAQCVGTCLPGKDETILAWLERAYQRLHMCPAWAPRTNEAANAWLEDCATIL